MHRADAPRHASSDDATRVLVADDDRDIRDLVAFKLGQAGYEVETAEDGVRALAQARSTPPSLVVLDVMMPGLSGMDVARQLRADPRTAAVPIIMLTAKAQETDVECGFAVGVDDYVIKPFSPRELLSRVRALLARTAAAR
jgi:DNA-binding response OmpR family regulator